MKGGDNTVLLFPRQVRFHGCKETVRRSRALNALQGESETDLKHQNN